MVTASLQKPPWLLVWLHASATEIGRVTSGRRGRIALHRSRVHAIHRLIGWRCRRWRAVLCGYIGVVQDRRLSWEHLLIAHGLRFRLASTAVAWDSLIAHARATVISAANAGDARSAATTDWSDVVAEAITRIALRRIGNPFAPIHFVRAAGGACQVVA